MQMKLKMVRSLLALSLAIILVIGGTTMAWFTAEFNLPSAAEMVVGTLAFEITDASVYSIADGKLEGEVGETIEWQAGKCKEFRWTFKNTGSKTSFFRARVDCELTRFTQRETAWGDGDRFVEKETGKWARYFTHDIGGGTTVTTLLAGQYYDAGTVTVWEEADKLHVRYDTKGDWYLTETHLGIANSMNGLLEEDKELPSPGQFPYKNNHNLVQDFTYVLDLPGYNPVYLAAHARVVKAAEIAAGDQINWSLPAGSAWEVGSDGWFYYCQPVKSGEEITLVLIGCLSADAEGGICNIELQAEAVQASHGAADTEWPYRPKP